jgi:hypothetical protein
MYGSYSLVAFPLSVSIGFGILDNCCCDQAHRAHRIVSRTMVKN